ncbi:MAG: hypothetical protein PWQ18_940 [Clostridia bacterium]|nr:hypothetical protein [Clostridia bacterium]
MANIVPVRVGTQTAGTVVTFFEASRLQNLEHNFHFVRTFSRRLGRRLNPDHLHSVHLLQEYSWPGNVRELMNFSERFVALAGQHPDQDELLQQLLAESRRESSPGSRLNLLEKGSWKETWQELEKNLLEQMLAESGMTKTALASFLGIDRTTLWKKLKKSKGGG